MKADSASQEAANEKAKAGDDVKSQKVLHHEAKKAKLQAHHDSKEASLKAVKAHEEKSKSDKVAKEAAKPDAPEHVKVEAKRQAHVAAKAHQEAQDAQVRAHASSAKAAQVTVQDHELTAKVVAEKNAADSAKAEADHQAKKEKT